MSNTSNLPAQGRQPLVPVRLKFYFKYKKNLKMLELENLEENFNPFVNRDI